MLALTRKLQERIQITVPASSVPRVIDLKVIEIRKSLVRLGFEADQDIRIHREEIQALVNLYGEDIPGHT